MDDIVKAALQKWPHVPHCHGWLALDARGDWYMRDEQVQAAGPFPQIKGSRIEHAALRDFIARNYTSDDAGAWFFQNGPQRVYVELQAAPWVWRLNTGAGGVTLRSHTGRAALFNEAIEDEHGRLFAASDIGLGLVHTLDMEAAANAIERGDWPLRQVAFAALPRLFGYQLTPKNPLQEQGPPTGC